MNKRGTVPGILLPRIGEVKQGNAGAWLLDAPMMLR